MRLSASSPRGRWMTLIAALLGWMFDGLEMGLFPLVARPALGELLQTTDRAEVGRWVAIITAGFLIGAATGGVLFGWLGDRIGRVKAMSLSVLTYAVFSGVCGLATEAWQVAAFRFIASLGMGGEWSLGVALVMEVWPDRSRAWLAAFIGAAANAGYLLIALLSLALTAIASSMHSGLMAVGLGQETTDWLTGNSGWRILMLCGALPAVLTFLIRLFVPESERWLKENERGSTTHWQTRDLLGVLMGASAGCGLIAFWAFPEIAMPVRVAGSLVMVVLITLGYLYPILRFVQRHQASATPTGESTRKIVRRLLLAAALSGVALLGTWGSTQWIPTWADELASGEPTAKAYTQICTAGGACLGCVLAALAGDWLGRRLTYFLLCIGSIASIAGIFQLNDAYGVQLLAMAFIAGAITAAFYGWLPLYLPELFTTKIRATGQGFGFNFGRVLAAIGVLQLPVVMRNLEVGWPGACTAMSAVYLVGMILIWFAPETRGKPLPE